MEKNKNNYSYNYNYITGVCIAELLTCPIQTIITNYQTSNNNIPTIIKNIFYKQHITGFYNSLNYSILSKTISSTTKYNIYQNMKLYRNTNDSDLYNNIFNSAFAGCVGGIISHPIDVCINYKQRNQKIIFGTKLLSGMTTTIFRNLMLYSLLFSLYDYVRIKTNNIIFSCFLTSFITTTMMSPIDYIRTNIMTGKILYKNIIFANIYRGYSMALLKNTIHFTTTMSVMNFFSQ